MLNIYTIRDKKVGTYFPPTYNAHLASLQRALQEVCNDPQHNFHKHASDFELYELGKFDENTGEILAHEKPLFLQNLTEFQSHPNNKGAEK